MPALRSRSDSVPYPSKPQAHIHAAALGLQVATDEYIDFHMSSSHPTIGIVSPTPRALSFPQHPAFDLDGPTPRAFSFPANVHDAFASLPLGSPLTPPEPSPSTPSTSPSPFEPDRDRDLASLAIARRSQSQQRMRTGTASPAAQIGSFNAVDPAHGGPITLAHRRRGSSISSLAIPQPPQPQSAQQSLTHTLQLNGPERKPKRGDEDYIKRPENAFILFRRECCLKKNAEEAVAVSEGDAIARRQRQADLSKTISQQWRSLSAEDRKYWDDLAKQRKKEHEEMYPWYVYQPTRTREKKGKSSSSMTAGAGAGMGAGGKAAKKDGKKERREKRDKSTSRVRSANGVRTRNSSSCSTASTASASSSASTVDSEDFADFDSGDSYAGGEHFQLHEFDTADGDFDMADSESLPMSLMMPSLSNGLSIDTRNPLASFTLQTGPAHHSHHGHGHGHGHGHSLSAQIPTQTAQSLGPLSFVLPQGRRSTSAPGAPTPPPMPSDLFPSTIKIPTLLPSSSPSPIDQSQSHSEEARAQEQQQGMVASSPDMCRSSENAGVCGDYGMGAHEQQAMQSFHFPAHAMNPMGFANLSGQVPDFSSAGGDMQHNAMFQIYEQQVPDTARPNRVRALSHIAIPNTPSTGGPLSAPAPSSSQTSSSQRLYLPGQQHFSPNAGSALQMPQRAVPLGLPESPKPNSDWSDDFGLPAWAMPTLYAPSPGHDQGQCANQSQSQSHSQPAGYSMMGMDGEIDIDISTLPPFTLDIPGMGNQTGMGGGGLGMDGEHGMDSWSAMQFPYDDLLDTSQL